MAQAFPQVLDLKCLKVVLSYCDINDQLKSVKLNFPANHTILELKLQFTRTVDLTTVVGCSDEDRRVAAFTMKQQHCKSTGKFWDQLFTLVFDEMVLENDATPLGLGIVDGDNIVLCRKTELTNDEKMIAEVLDFGQDSTMIRDSSTGSLVPRREVERKARSKRAAREKVFRALTALSRRKMQSITGGLNVVVGEPDGVESVQSETSPLALPTTERARRAQLGNMEFALVPAMFLTIKLYHEVNKGYPRVKPLLDKINTKICEHKYSQPEDCVADLTTLLKNYKSEAEAYGAQSHEVREVRRSSQGGSVTVVCPTDLRELDARRTLHDNLVRCMKAYRQTCDVANAIANKNIPLVFHKEMAKMIPNCPRFKTKKDLEERGYSSLAPLCLDGHNIPVGGYRTECYDVVDALFYVGPVRNSNENSWMSSKPIVIIKNVKGSAKLSDLVETYFQHQYGGPGEGGSDRPGLPPDTLYYDNSALSLDTRVDTIFLNNKHAALNKFYCAFPTSYPEKEDTRDIDSLLGFIEGKAFDEKKSKRKYKNKKKTKKVGEAQNAADCGEEAVGVRPAGGAEVPGEVPVAGEVGADGEAEEEVQCQALKGKKKSRNRKKNRGVQNRGYTHERLTSPVHNTENNPRSRNTVSLAGDDEEFRLAQGTENLQINEGLKLRAEMKAENPEVYYSEEDEPEDEAASEDISLKELSDAIAIKVNKEMESKKSELSELELDKIELEASLEKETELLRLHNEAIKAVVASKSKEIQDIEEMIKQNKDTIEENKTRLAEVDDLIQELESQLMNYENKREDVINRIKTLELSNMKISKKRDRIELFLKKEMDKAKDEIGRLESRIEIITHRISENRKQILNLPFEPIEGQPSSFQSSESNPNEPLIQFIDKQIGEKEKELECPVCFETATAPIYMCTEQHLVCALCR